jgi:hypothetical protein
MAEDVKDKSDDIQKKDDKKEKQTNKTFTQSEFDSAISKVKEDGNEKIKELETKLNETTELLSGFQTKQKELERAKMTELEREKAEKSEISSQVEQLIQENQIFKQQLLIKDIVDNDPNFDKMPRIYKQNIKGDTVEAITESASTMLDEWKKDIKGVNSQRDVGAPDIGVDSSVSAEQKPLSIAQQFKQKFIERGLQKE